MRIVSRPNGCINYWLGPDARSAFGRVLRVPPRQELAQIPCRWYDAKQEKYACVCPIRDYHPSRLLNCTDVGTARVPEAVPMPEYAPTVPDLPGCITTGKTIEETASSIREAIELYIDTLRGDGKPIPEPQARPVAIAA